MCFSTHCNILQHTATNRNTLQHTATTCNINKMPTTFSHIYIHHLLSTYSKIHSSVSFNSTRSQILVVAPCIYPNEGMDPTKATISYRPIPLISTLSAPREMYWTKNVHSHALVQALLFRGGKTREAGVEANSNPNSPGLFSWNTLLVSFPDLANFLICTQRDFHYQQSTCQQHCIFDRKSLQNSGMTIQQRFDCIIFDFEL